MIEVGDLIVEKSSLTHILSGCVEVLRIEDDGMLWVNDYRFDEKPFRSHPKHWRVWKSVGERVAREFMGVGIEDEEESA